MPYAARHDSPASQNKKNSTRRVGLTLVELLLSLTIISVLIALLIPAVQYAREAARSATCKNHLKQLGLGLANYETVYGAYPLAITPMGYGPHFQMLPFLEGQSFYDRVDQSKISLDDEVYQNLNFARFSLFACPADGIDSSDRAGLNYPGCASSGPQKNGWDGLFSAPGILGDNHSSGQIVRVSSISDGLSATACFSEALLGDDGTSPRRSFWRINERMDEPSQFNLFAWTCSNVSTQPASTSIPWVRGYRWWAGGIPSSLYTHVLNPNAASCYPRGNGMLSAASATSHHAGGANLCFVDGHIQFVAEGIDIEIWREIASRSSSH